MHSAKLLVALMGLVSFTSALPATSSLVKADIGASLSNAEISRMTKPEFESMYNVTLADTGGAELELVERNGWQHLWPAIPPEPVFSNAPFCHYNDPGSNQCTLVNRMMPGDPPDYTGIYLYDHNCVLIGINEHVVYGSTYGFDSQLRWVVVLEDVKGGDLGWWYAGKFWNRANFHSYHCYAQVNVGDSNQNPYPVCEMNWDC